jgi:hypothetical protein
LALAAFSLNILSSPKIVEKDKNFDWFAVQKCSAAKLFDNFNFYFQRNLLKTFTFSVQYSRQRKKYKLLAPIRELKTSPNPGLLVTGIYIFG